MQLQKVSMFKGALCSVTTAIEHCQSINLAHWSSFPVGSRNIAFVFMPRLFAPLAAIVRTAKTPEVIPYEK
jgi:hypothetical protein